MVLQMHLVRHGDVADPALGFRVGRQHPQVLASEVLAQVAGGIELSWTRSSTTSTRGWFGSIASAAPTHKKQRLGRSFSSLTKTHIAARNTGLSCRSWLATLGAATAVDVTGAADGPPLLHDAVGGDCLDGIIPPSVVALEGGLDRGGERGDQALLD
ncbi:hypothetical protein NKR23_g10460 [Pleurostoma richardsiae]|uniref:Uncharacterized protein n=1 Tax=Pleurostoma richardsiae TaxID=41990 RepID=A0AA38R2T8_9PEZI|nr:hypothetical protein NKR23_g10460 [Pleurostoma richardsiae]